MYATHLPGKSLAHDFRVLYALRVYLLYARWTLSIRCFSPGTCLSVLASHGKAWPVAFSSARTNGVSAKVCQHVEDVGMHARQLLFINQNEDVLSRPSDEIVAVGLALNNARNVKGCSRGREEGLY